MKLLFTITLSTILFLSSNTSKAQLTVDTLVSPSQLEFFLQGFGMTISNLTINCASEAMGTFNGANSNIGINQGLALTTGSIYNMIGPNNSSSISTANNTPGDADLDTLGGTTTYDACVIEFDCVPVFNLLLFNFAFGSEEYIEFVDAGFNDVFAIYISGTGISGHKNIALVPGTVVPVAIDNVNHQDYPQYYNDNGDGNSAPQNTDSTVIQYDGFTTNLIGQTNVTPGQTYHFKIAVADVGDSFFDSGVVLEGNSFRSIQSTGIDEATSTTEVRVYPSPVTHTATFMVDAPLTNATFTLYDALGKVVKRKTNINGTQFQFDKGAIPGGIYLYSLLDEHGMLVHGKLMIE